MTPEKLLLALNEIDGETIREAHASGIKHPKMGKRHFAVLIAAVIALTALTLTAFASNTVTDWLLDYFSRWSKGNLSHGQIDFILENEQAVTDTQTQNGYTLVLKSAITDGYVAYITMSVTGPENAVLSKTVIEGYSPEKPSLYTGNMGPGVFSPADGPGRGCSVSFASVEDNDGLDYTQNLLLTVRPPNTSDDAKAFEAGSVWNLHIENIMAGYRNDAYLKELDEKYPDGNNLLTDEEGEKAFPQVLLAEGVWDFEITFSDSDFRELELISKPVATLASIGWKPDGTDVYEEVTITSFVLRSLSATIRYDYDAAVDFTNNFDKLIFAVMKDGSQVRLFTKSGFVGQSQLMADAPILLDEVAYILLADGTKLTVPQS